MSRSRRGRAKRAQRNFDEAMRAALRTAHEEGLHTDGTTSIIDPTGYWREYGCELCIAAHEAWTEVDAFTVRDRHSSEVRGLRVDVFTLTERADESRVWTAIVYPTNPEHDTVIEPSGGILKRGILVPAGIWFRLSEEYGKEEN
jgi:hypothetical protein